MKEKKHILKRLNQEDIYIDDIHRHLGQARKVNSEVEKNFEDLINKLSTLIIHYDKDTNPEHFANQSIQINGDEIDLMARILTKELISTGVQAVVELSEFGQQTKLGNIPLRLMNKGILAPHAPVLSVRTSHNKPVNQRKYRPPKSARSDGRPNSKERVRYNQGDNFLAAHAREEELISLATIADTCPVTDHLMKDAVKADGMNYPQLSSHFRERMKSVLGVEDSKDRSFAIRILFHPNAKGKLRMKSSDKLISTMDCTIPKSARSVLIRPQSSHANIEEQTIQKNKSNISEQQLENITQDEISELLGQLQSLEETEGDRNAKKQDANQKEEKNGKLKEQIVSDLMNGIVHRQEPVIENENFNGPQQPKPIAFEIDYDKLADYMTRVKDVYLRKERIMIKAIDNMRQRVEEMQKYYAEADRQSIIVRTKQTQAIMKLAYDNLLLTKKIERLSQHRKQ